MASARAGVIWRLKQAGVSRIARFYMAKSWADCCLGAQLGFWNGMFQFFPDSLYEWCELLTV